MSLLPRKVLKLPSLQPLDQEDLYMHIAVLWINNILQVKPLLESFNLHSGAQRMSAVYWSLIT